MCVPAVLSSSRRPEAGSPPVLTPLSTLGGILFLRETGSSAGGQSPHTLIPEPFLGVSVDLGIHTAASTCLDLRGAGAEEKK